MPPSSILRVPVWLIYLLSLSHAHDWRAACVRQGFDHSRQEYAADVRVGRRGAALPLRSVNRPGGVRDAERYLPSTAFSGLVVFEAVLQFAHASLDLFPRGICNPWQL